jgi:hypothetical protein
MQKRGGSEERSLGNEKKEGKKERKKERKREIVGR